MRHLLAIPFALLLGACSSAPQPIARDLGISGIPALKAANVKSRTAAVKASTSTASASTAARAAKTQIEEARKLVEEPLPQKLDEQEHLISKLRSNLSEAALQITNLEKELETTKGELQVIVEAAGQKDAAAAQLESSVKIAEEKHATAVARNDFLAADNIRLGTERDEAKSSKGKWMVQTFVLYAIVIGFVAWKLKAFLLFAP